MPDLRNGERTWNAYDESWEFGNSHEDCEHLSASGIDQTDIDDEAKVWRCDGCGWLYRSLRPENAPPMVRVMRGLSRSEQDQIGAAGAHDASQEDEAPTDA